MMFEPSRRRIKRMTRAFRRKWDEKTRLMRGGYTLEQANKKGQWEPPIINERELEQLFRHLHYDEHG